VGDSTGSWAERRTECLALASVPRGFPGVAERGNRGASGRIACKPGRVCAAVVSNLERGAGRLLCLAAG